MRSRLLLLAAARSCGSLQHQWRVVPIGGVTGTSTGSAEALTSGASVFLLSEVVSAEERAIIAQACLRAATARDGKPSAGMLRLSTSRAVETEHQLPVPIAADELICERILPRVCALVDEHLPALFDGELARLYDDGHGLEFACREPAVNVYGAGDEFLGHEDGKTLTVLIPVADDAAFTGGGTGFWSQDSRGHRAEPPTVSLRPAAGDAMLFGGCVTHAGLPVKTGERVVVVASFSRKRR